MRPEVTFTSRHPTRRRFLTLTAGLIGATPFMAPETATAAEKSVTFMKPTAAYVAAQKGEIILIDIRRPDEWAETNVAEGAVGLDMRDKDFVSTLVSLRQANPDLPIALICRTGARTEYVTTTLAAQGFSGLVDVSEGMVGGRNGPGWLKVGLPTYEGSLANVAARRKLLPL
ncbi:MAG: rhodanese-like domain-containing protein [Rhodobacteraceae bacterium]|nr:rhodanese-like domain-containing protein [Paracoccaceae bacterium]